MSKVAIKGAATGTGVFTLESPATNTDRTLVLPDEAGTVLTSASSIVQNTGAVFKAYTSANQSIPHNTLTKVLCGVTLYNEGNFWDTATSKFTPNTSGYYQINASGRLSSNTNQYLQIFVRKNGNPLLSQMLVIVGNGSGEIQVSICDVVYLNGTTDYLELYAYQYDYTSTGARNLFSGASDTFISGHLIRTA